MDTDELVRLLPADPLTLLSEPEVPSWEVPRQQGRRPRYSGDEAAALMREVCGVDDPVSFQHLDRVSQKAAVRELRLRSVPFNQMAGLTGLSSTSLKRLHATRGDA